MPISSLAQKLRIKAGQTLLILNAPKSFFNLLGGLPQNKIESGNVSGISGFILLFIKDSNELEHWFPQIINLVGEDTVFWISYPKQTSKIVTDLNRDKGWEVVFDAGYRPVSAVAIDSDWTALRFKKGTFTRISTPSDKSIRTINIPDDFKLALSAQEQALPMFEKLAYTHRKEYIQWIEGAKKVETRERRINQAIEKIVSGKKLN